MANVWPCSPSTEDTLIITVSSCGVKLQEVLSGLEKKKAKKVCTFVAFLNIHLLHFFSISTWGVMTTIDCCFENASSCPKAIAINLNLEFNFVL